MNRLRANHAAALAVSLSIALALSVALALSFTGGAPSTAPPMVGPDDMRPTAGTSQTARLLMHPQIAQPGSAVVNAMTAKSAVSAVFRPIRAGRKVVLQRKKGTSWVSVTTRTQNGRGIAEFTAPYKINGRIVTYRAVAVRSGSLGKIATSAVATNRWGNADFTEQFSGTFTGNDLPSRWDHRIQDYGEAGYRTCASSRAAATRVANGTARLSVKKGPKPGMATYCTNPEDGRQYEWRINGNIGTQGNFAYKYGYAAARIKFQPRAGQHGSFWLQPNTIVASSGSPTQTGAEIDAIEWFGNRTQDGTELSNMVHYYPSDGVTKKVGSYISNPARFGTDWASKYHVFSVEWTPSAYIFRIDGKQTKRITQGISGQQEYLLLSPLSSDFELKFAGRDAVTQTMYVDWVRVWDRTR
jgi:beta-glucanase (GH16 family)